MYLVFSTKQSQGAAKVLSVWQPGASVKTRWDSKLHGSHTINVTEMLCLQIWPQHQFYWSLFNYSVVSGAKPVKINIKLLFL